MATDSHIDAVFDLANRPKPYGDRLRPHATKLIINDKMTEASNENISQHLLGF